MDGLDASHGSACCVRSVVEVECGRKRQCGLGSGRSGGKCSSRMSPPSWSATNPVVLACAFTTAGLDRLEAVHHPDNPASGRVLTKTGFIRTGTCERHADDGTAVAYQVYALPLP